MCLPQVLDRPHDHPLPTRRALDGGRPGANVVVNIGAEAEGVGVARERCLAPWAGELGAGVRCGMRASVSAISLRAACSVCVALHHLALSAGRGQEGQIAGAVCCARKMQKVYW